MQSVIISDPKQLVNIDTDILVQYPSYEYNVGNLGLTKNRFHKTFNNNESIAEANQILNNYDKTFSRR